MSGILHNDRGQTSNRCERKPPRWLNMETLNSAVKRLNRICLEQNMYQEKGKQNVVQEGKQLPSVY